MEITKQHEIVGKTLEQVRGLDLGTLYPVINNPVLGKSATVIGVFSAEFGSPVGFSLSDSLQAYIPNLTELEIEDA